MTDDADDAVDEVGVWLFNNNEGFLFIIWLVDWFDGCLLFTVIDDDDCDGDGDIRLFDGDDGDGEDDGELFRKWLIKLALVNMSGIWKKLERISLRVTVVFDVDCDCVVDGDGDCFEFDLFDDDDDDPLVLRFVTPKAANNEFGFGTFILRGIDAVGVVVDERSCCCCCCEWFVDDTESKLDGDGICGGGIDVIVADRIDDGDDLLLFDDDDNVPEPRSIDDADGDKDDEVVVEFVDDDAKQANDWSIAKPRWFDIEYGSWIPDCCCGCLIFPI